MPTLMRDIREAFFLKFYQDLPPIIKEKINLIEELYGEAILFQSEELSRAVPDFDEHIRKRRQEAKSFYISPEETRRLFQHNASSPEEEQKEGVGGLDEIIAMADPKYEPCSELVEPGPELVDIDPYSELVAPGDRLNDHAHMLMALWFFWIHPDARSQLKAEIKKRRILERAADLETVLDLSLAKLTIRVAIETGTIRHYHKKKEAAVQLNLSQKIHISNKAVDAFHQVPKKQGDTRNAIVTLIYKYLIKTGQTKVNKCGRISPGVKTIERALKGNKPLMESCFTTEQRGKKERIICIGHTSV